MGVRMVFVVFLGLGLAANAPAQTVLASDAFQQPLYAAVSAPARPRLAVDGDFLLWWLSGNPVPRLINSALPTTDLAATLEAGGLSDPTAFTVYGGRRYSANPMPGFRIGVGYLLDEERGLGLELSGLYVTPRVDTFRIASDGTGNPPIILTLREVFFPGFGPNDVETGGVFAGLFSAVPEGFLTGQAQVRSTISLWGGEANAFLRSYPTGAVTVDLLGGFRYLGMQDTLEISASVTSAGNGATYDRFRVTNHFYGGQVGARVNATYNRLTASLATRIALGGTNQEFSISGNRILPEGVPDDGAPGGFYAVSSNLGNTSRNRLAFVPDVNVNFGYALTDHIHLTVGYTFLYWSSVGRSGDQVDRNYNTGLNPVFGAGTDRSGPRFPARLDKGTDFWAQGINLGLSLRY